MIIEFFGFTFIVGEEDVSFLNDVDIVLYKNIGT
jgi:hypothetical protein